MPYCSFDMARRICAQLGLVILILAIASSTARADISSGLRGLLQGALGADLRVDSLTLDKAQATVGDTLRATVNISNVGRAAAASTLLTVWAQYGASTSTAGAYRLASVRLGTLPPQARITSVSTFPVPNFGRVGAYQIFATVEAAAPEQNRLNNTQAKTLMVLGPAVSDTDPEPVSDDGTSSTPPAPPSPVAGGGSTTPPPSSPVPGGGSTPPPPSGPVAGGGSTSPPSSGGGTSDPGSGSSQPPTSDPGSGSTPPPPSSDPTPPPPAPPPPVAGASCDYYASPNGRGTGTTPESPFRIQNFWGLASPGKTLCLLNGTYTGAESMIDPGVDARGLSGTSTRPITVRALNDGGVVIDGQFARSPVTLSGNSWWVLEGFNAKNGPCSAQSVIQISGQSNNNIVRRLVAWDACIWTNATVFGIHSSTGNLFEDVAGFGTGRKVFSTSQGGNNTTCRRCWARWEGSIAVGPKLVYEPLYNAFGFTCENCLGQVSGESMPEIYYPAGDTTRPRQTDFTIYNSTGYAMIMTSSAWSGENCGRLKVLGSLFYVRPNDNFSHGSVVRATGDPGRNCLEYRHVLVFVHPSHPRFSITDGFRLTTSSLPAGETPQFTATNLTSVRSDRTGDKIDGFWTSRVTNLSAASSRNRVTNPWTTTAGGANLCRKWGVNEPLWPWPMDARISEATASAGSYAGPCPTCNGGRFVRTATSVTAIVETLLGPIPSACKR